MLSCVEYKYSVTLDCLRHKNDDKLEFHIIPNKQATRIYSILIHY